MPAAHTADSKTEEKLTTTAAASSAEKKPEAKDSPKPNESAVSSSPSSSAAPAVPTPSTSTEDEDKSPETSTATSKEPSSTSAAETSEDSMDDVIDMETFQQIVELDEEDDHEFTVEMMRAFFSQAEQTFSDMEAAFSKKDVGKLSSLGHFLKGSSAALGVKKVQASCEDIQHYGLLRDETAGTDLTVKEALEMINNRIEQARKDYRVAEKWLKGWIADNAQEEDVD